MDGQGNGGDAGVSQCDVVARAFVDHYYRTFDTDRAALAALYGQTSMLSFEGHAVAGTEEIGRKLAQLPFQQCRHSVCTVDCQPSPSFPGSILVFVSGNLQLAGEEHQLRFSQVGAISIGSTFCPLKLFLSWRLELQCCDCSILECRCFIWYPTSRGASSCRMTYSGSTTADAMAGGSVWVPKGSRCSADALMPHMDAWRDPLFFFPFAFGLVFFSCRFFF